MDPDHMTIVHFALGTNLGNRVSNLRHALASFPPSIHVLEESAIYETPPWGITHQPHFLNMVVKGLTALRPVQLLAYLKQLEQNMGRLPGLRYGPRLIDLDILFYDDLVLETPELCIPHPRLHERAFVLVPLADISPTLVHPTLGQTIADLLNNVDTEGITPYEGIDSPTPG